jgi:FixJ family two-component response regulator
MSGLGDGEKVARARQAGVSHFLAKPYTSETILHVLKTILGGGVA